MLIQLKKLGKKKIKTIEVVLEKQPETLRELISECVKSEVKREKLLLGIRKTEPWLTFM